MIRAFLALQLPEPLQDALTIAQHKLPLARPVPRENLHVTLAFLGSVREPELEELDTALSLAVLPQVSLRLDGFGTFGGNEPDNLHARIALTPALGSLHSRVCRLVRQSGLSLDARKFVPHVTLARFRKHEVLADTLARALEKHGGLTSPEHLSRELVLFRSTLRADAPPLYDPLASYPLMP